MISGGGLNAKSCENFRLAHPALTSTSATTAIHSPVLLYQKENSIICPIYNMNDKGAGVDYERCAWL